MDTDSRSDLDLLMAIQERGDCAALGALYDRYGCKIYTLAYGILRCQEGAENVLQEVFERVWKKSHTFQSSLGEVKHWLLRMTHNLSIKRIKSADTTVAPLKVEQAMGETKVSIEYSVETDTNFEINDQLRQTLHYLPKEQRRLFELAFSNAFGFGDYRSSKQKSSPREHGCGESGSGVLASPKENCGVSTIASRGNKFRNLEL